MERVGLEPRTHTDADYCLSQLSIIMSVGLLKQLETLTLILMCTVSRIQPGTQLLLQRNAASHLCGTD